MPGLPVVSVVVASHARELRLRWLLNALEEQRVDEAWEIVVVHDYDEVTAERVIDSHPLAAAGLLTHHVIEPGTGSPSRQRNIGWRAARGDLIAFTDDDCRPDPGWLSGLLEAARSSPGAAVQGQTRPDPLEEAVLRAPHVRTLWIEPVGPYFQTANMLYPRALLEQVDGFDERSIAGEDIGLSLRVRAAGAKIVGAPQATVYHAIESHTLLGIVRQNLKWRYLAYLVKQHPEFRRDLTLAVFWDRDHLLTSAAVVGLLGGRRHPLLLLLVAPYVRRALGRRGRGGRARAIAAAELPGQLIRQTAEVAGMAVGSVQNRTLLL